MILNLQQICLQSRLIRQKEEENFKKWWCFNIQRKGFIWRKESICIWKTKINSDEDAANDKLEDGPITASNNITNGSKDDLPPPPPPPMPSKVTKAKHTLVEKCKNQHQPKSNN